MDGRASRARLPYSFAVFGSQFSARSSRLALLGSLFSARSFRPIPTAVPYPWHALTPVFPRRPNRRPRRAAFIRFRALLPSSSPPPLAGTARVATRRARDVPALRRQHLLRPGMGRRPRRSRHLLAFTARRPTMGPHGARGGLPYADPHRQAP